MLLEVDEVRIYRWTRFGALTLMSCACIFILVSVFAHRVHDFHDFRVLNLFTMGVAVVTTWLVNVREMKSMSPSSDSTLHARLANTTFSMALLVDLSVLAGMGLLMYH